MRDFPHSYIAGMFGLHRVTIRGHGPDTRIHFFVMKNVFASHLKIHRVYDLKVRAHACVCVCQCVCVRAYVRRVPSACFWVAVCVCSRAWQGNMSMRVCMCVGPRVEQSSMRASSVT